MRKAIVLLSILVVISGCVTEATYNQVVSQNQTYQELNQALRAELAADQAQIQQLQNRLKVTLLDEIVFPEGGWEIGPRGRETLNKIVPTLKGLTNQRIEVLGFTDNVPIGPELRRRFPSNWELSTARATDVVRYLQQQGVNPAIMSATGYGDQQPVASNSTPDGRRKNRRIEIELAAQNQ